MTGEPSIELDEIMATKSGSVDPVKFPDEIFDLYSIPAFDHGEPEVIAGKEIGSAKQIVEPGDVLLSKIVPHIRRSWVVGTNRGRRIIASGEWIVFRSNRVHPGYLRHVLVGDPFHAQFMSTVSGVGGSLLRARPAHVARISIPLPPLPEQRRIAEILDKADALRAKRCAALDQLGTLTQSIFLDMFGNPATNPKGWPVDPLGDLMSEVYRYPTYYGIRYVEKGVPEIRGELLNEDGTIVTDATALRYISPETSKRFPRTVLAEGDLVMSVRGTVGKTAVVPAALAGANMTANLLRLAPDRNRAHPTYVWHFMQTEWFRSQLANACSNTTIQTIKAPDLKRIGVIRPPIDYQRDFNRILSFIQAQKTVMTAGMAGLDSLFVSTQHRAFRGEL